MATCQLCIPWNLPLTMPAHRSVNGALSGLSYENWFVYHLHVVIHQAGNWAGDLETAKPTLAPLPETVL